MDKYEFLMALEDGLSALPEEDRRRSIDFYAEMIDDRIEDGLSEEEAVAAIGDVNEIIRQILLDTSLPKLVKAKVKTKRSLRAWEIVLLVLGCPLWLPLLAAAAAVLLAVYVVIWTVVLCLFVTLFALALASVAVFIGAVVNIVRVGIFGAAAAVGIGLIGAGIAILFYFFCRVVVKAIVWLSKQILRGIKSCFIWKGDR